MASFLDSAGIIAISVSLALWQDHYALSVWQVGGLGFAEQIFLAVGALVGGGLADRFGRQRVFNIDIALLTVGLLIILLAPNSVVLLIGIALFGLCVGADLPVSLAVISDRAELDQRGRLISLTQVMWALGILVASALGFTVATLGFAGTKVIFIVLAVLGIVTFVLRLFVSRDGFVPVLDVIDTRPDRSPMREVLRRPVVGVLTAITGFYTFWNIVAGMLAGYTTYFLVTASHASQELATGLNLAFVPISAVLAFTYIRVADSKWRERLFVIAGAIEVVGLLVGALTGGAVLGAVIVMLVIFNVTNPAAGEGLYKVWGQKLFPTHTRALAQGLSFTIARVVFACFLLIAPALLAWSVPLFLWILTLSMAIAYAFGLFIARRLVPGAAASGTGREVNSVDDRP
jgi:inositol transporter-like SP family MFS transporter